MKDLKNRIALVTGGSRGIGAAVAIALARAGAHVAVNYRERADAANAVGSEITKTGGKAIAVQADVSVAAAVRRMVAEIEAHLGGIDILVNNAAIAHPRKLEEITEAEWDEVLTVNLKSVFFGHAGCGWWYAAKKVGADHQLVFGRCTDRWGCGGALRRVQGGNHWADALLRFIAYSRWNHRERHCPGSD
jgi:NAD(P)-dependent dehydrogenase (short-subunit alcohol dehydrogenase family)